MLVEGHLFWIFPYVPASEGHLSSNSSSELLSVLTLSALNVPAQLCGTHEDSLPSEVILHLCSFMYLLQRKEGGTGNMPAPGSD